MTQHAPWVRLLWERWTHTTLNISLAVSPLHTPQAAETFHKHLACQPAAQRALWVGPGRGAETAGVEGWGRARGRITEPREACKLIYMPEIWFFYLWKRAFLYVDQGANMEILCKQCCLVSKQVFFDLFSDRGTRTKRLFMAFAVRAAGLPYWWPASFWPLSPVHCTEEQVSYLHLHSHTQSYTHTRVPTRADSTSSGRPTFAPGEGEAEIL